MNNKKAKQMICSLISDDVFVMDTKFCYYDDGYVSLVAKFSDGNLFDVYHGYSISLTANQLKSIK